MLDSIVCTSDSFNLQSHAIAHSFAGIPVNPSYDTALTTSPPTNSYIPISSHSPSNSSLGQLENHYLHPEPVHLLDNSSANHSTPFNLELTPTSDFGTTSSECTTFRGKPGRKRTINIETADQVDKRRRNNAAAAKYRQKKVDRIADLEKSLEDVMSDRDSLQLELAKKDAEIALLNRLLAEKGRR